MPNSLRDARDRALAPFKLKLTAQLQSSAGHAQARGTKGYQNVID